MPTYTFRNKKTNKEVTLVMTMAEHTDYVKNNPNMVQVFNQMNIVDPAGIGVSKPPADFQKYVLGKVKAANPHSDAVASKRWDIPKEI